MPVGANTANGAVALNKLPVRCVDVMSCLFICALRVCLFYLRSSPLRQCNAVQPKKKLGKAMRMKNPKKLAASKKKPNLVRYFMGGRTVVSRDPQYIEDYRD